MASDPPAEIGIDITDDHVATVEIRRPPNNFFSLGMLAALADALDDLADEDDVRAVVLCSQGKHFCAGADFSDRPAPSETRTRHIYDEAARLFRQPLPIVAAIQGAAIGGGLGLAMAADFRIAAPAARMSANFARLGFHQGFALSVTLPRVLGQQAAQEVLFTGKRYSGEDARRLGLVDRLVPRDELRSAAHAMAAEIAQSAPLAVLSIRETLRQGLAEEAVSAMARERSEQERLQLTDDWIEGTRAMAQRRPPRFTGR